MPVLLNVMVGNCSTSRKSGDFKWASRRASFVINEPVSIVASTEAAVKSSSSRSTATPHAREMPPHRHEAHMFRGKLDLRVHWIDGPAHLCPPGLSAASVMRLQ